MSVIQGIYQALEMAAPPLKRPFMLVDGLAHHQLKRELECDLHFVIDVGELLVDTGLFGKEELEMMPARALQAYEKLPTPKVMLARSEEKYTCSQAVKIDCASRVYMCKAKCCTFDFYLTQQYLDEGIARWDYGCPTGLRAGRIATTFTLNQARIAAVYTPTGLMLVEHMIAGRIRGCGETFERVLPNEL